MLLERLSDHDREVLREQCADKIEALLPMTRMGESWRLTFEAEASRLSSLAERNIEDNSMWAIAHAFVLRENPVAAEAAERSKS